MKLQTIGSAAVAALLLASSAGVAFAQTPSGTTGTTGTNSSGYYYNTNGTGSGTTGTNTSGTSGMNTSSGSTMTPSTNTTSSSSTGMTNTSNGSATTRSTTNTPGVPNTGAGGDMTATWVTLAIAALAIIAGAAYWARQRAVHNE